MTDYENEVAKAEKLGLVVKDELEFESKAKGALAGRKVLISKNAATESEKKCVLWEEVSHYRLNCGDILDQGDGNNRHQELKAHRKMVRDNLPLKKIVSAIVSLGTDTNICEVAETLEVTEKFLREAIDTYGAEFGPCTRIGGFLVTFEPFNVGKMDDFKNGK